MSLRALENWFYGSVRHSSAPEVAARIIRTWDVSSLSAHKYCLVTSYRKSGSPVSTPVWFGIDGDHVFVRSGAEDGKVKRIRRNPNVLVAPCTARGAPLADPIKGTARILAPEEHARAEAAVRAHYGLGRKLYRLVRRRLDVAYLEISPLPAD